MEYQYDQFGRLTRANTRHDGFGSLTQQSVTKGQMTGFTLFINRVHTIYSTQCYKTSIFPARNERLVPKRDQDRPRVHFHSAGGRLLQIGGEWVATDRLGSVVRKGTTNYKYAPYGQEIEGATAKGTTKFATYTRDSLSGLDYALNRYYKPEWGRFTSPDPYQGSAKPQSPLSWNRYTYTLGDPVNFNDPEGLDACNVAMVRTSQLDPTCKLILHGGGMGALVTFRETADSIAWETRMATQWAFVSSVNYAQVSAVSSSVTFPDGSVHSSITYTIRYQTQTLLNSLQTGLDAAGLIPGIGEAFDLVNAAIYLFRGNYVDAGRSFASMIPISGQAAIGVRIARKFSPDQSALIDLAKEAQRRGGVTRAEATTLRGWASEYGLSSRSPEVHPRRGFGSRPHIHVGPIDHIPVIP